MDKILVPVCDILLVDDDSDDIAFFKDAMEALALPVRITTVSSSVKMFHLLSTEKFDLIFLDINLPMMNGMEALKILKEKPEYRHIPVIMYSGSGSEYDIQNSFDSGAHYYMIKPQSGINYESILKYIFQIDWKKIHPQPLRSDYEIKSEAV